MLDPFDVTPNHGVLSYKSETVELESALMSGTPLLCRLDNDC